MRYRIIEESIAIQDLDLMHKLYGKCHEIHAGRIDREFQESKKPLAATRGNSNPNTKLTYSFN